MVVIDSLGIGATEDAGRFDSLGADTLGHLGKHFRIRLQLPTLQRMGLGNLHPIMGMGPLEKPQGAYGQMRSISTGLSDRESQWEMMGLPTVSEPDIFFKGVPTGIITALRAKTKRATLGNSLMSIKAALQTFGSDQLATGNLLLVSTSPSAVWLIGHEATITTRELQEDCQILRDLLDQSAYQIETVNGLLFKGNHPQNFYPQDLFTYPLLPSQPTVIDYLQNSGVIVKLLGKTSSLFGKVNNNALTGFDELDAQLDSDFTGLCITELGELNSRYGQQRDPEKFGQELMAVDHQLQVIINKLRLADLLIVTSNSGNDPTYAGERRTREYVPLLLTSPQITTEVNLGKQAGFANIGATILENFGIADYMKIGESLLEKL